MTDDVSERYAAFRAQALALKPETKAGLDADKCRIEGCGCGNDGLIHGPGCHQGAPCIATYYRSVGRLVLACGICLSPYASFIISDDFTVVH